jgi:hypothetical protein
VQADLVISEMRLGPVQPAATASLPRPRPGTRLTFGASQGTRRAFEHQLSSDTIFCAPFGTNLPSFFWVEYDCDSDNDNGNGKGIEKPAFKRCGGCERSSKKVRHTLLTTMLAGVSLAIEKYLSI